MKKFLMTFRIPKDGKVSDKTFTYNIVAGVVGILLCLTSLTAATWAWFGSAITSDKNTITSGQYSVTETVINIKDSENTEVVSVDGVYVLYDGTYSITLTGAGTVSTGFCTVSITENTEDGEKISKHTQQIFTPGSENTEEGKLSEISFELTVKNCDSVRLTVTPCWGTSAVTDGKICDAGVYEYDGAANAFDVTEGAETPPAEDTGDTESSEDDAQQ